MIFMLCTFIFAVLLQKQFFLLMFKYKSSVFHGHEDPELKIFWGHDFHF